MNCSSHDRTGLTRQLFLLALSVTVLTHSSAGRERGYSEEEILRSSDVIAIMDVERTEEFVSATNNALTRRATCRRSNVLKGSLPDVFEIDEQQNSLSRCRLPVQYAERTKYLVYLKRSDDGRYRTFGGRRGQVTIATPQPPPRISIFPMEEQFGAEALRRVRDRLSVRAALTAVTDQRHKDQSFNRTSTDAETLVTFTVADDDSAWPYVSGMTLTVLVPDAPTFLGMSVDEAIGQPFVLHGVEDDDQCEAGTWCRLTATPFGGRTSR